jgi:hypothetical protein
MIQKGYRIPDGGTFAALSWPELTDFMNRNDVRMVERGRGFSFSFKTFDEFWAGQGAGVDQLERDDFDSGLPGALGRRSSCRRGQFLPTVRNRQSSAGVCR